MTLKELESRAYEVLDKNWNGRFTIPSAYLYPHMWSWDSAFIAIGNSYRDVRRSMAELTFLFDAQWKNGMIPHVVFNKESPTYFPSPEFYDCRRSSDAPRHIATSGITQPPVHAIACYYVHANSPEEGKHFLKSIFPKLVAFHNYLMTTRDPEDSGAITIMHPWESGMDNSPVWDIPLNNVEIKKHPNYERKDLMYVSSPSEMPSDATYEKFIYLLELLKEANYNHAAVYREFPFKVKGTAITSILYVANKFLLKIADILSEDRRPIEAWQRKIEQNFEHNFTADPKDLLYYDFDLVSQGFLHEKTISSILPIYTGFIPRSRASAISGLLKNHKFCGTKLHVEEYPSSFIQKEYFSENTYWRGPFWVNTNWMIYYGLLAFGYRKKAEEIKNGIIELVKNHGFREYFDPFNGKGLGGQDFSWTAALLIDLIEGRDIGLPQD